MDGPSPPPSQGRPEYVAQPEGDAHLSPVCGKEQHFQGDFPEVLGFSCQFPNFISAEMYQVGLYHSDSKLC